MVTGQCSFAGFWPAFLLVCGLFCASLWAVFMLVCDWFMSCFLQVFGLFLGLVYGLFSVGF